MKIALVAHGVLPIPADNWGAVEGTIWQRTLHLRRLGHTVDIYNTPMVHEVLHGLNRGRYDFVHCHNELFALACNTHLTVPYALTTHFGGLHRFVPGGDHYASFDYLFQDCLRAPANIVLSERIRDLYLRAGYRGFLRVLRNTVETDQFRLATRGNGRAICLGRVVPRKRQAWLAEALEGRVEIDFVGPWEATEEPAFRENHTARYCGVWPRATVYERLTDYGCLVLLSESEAAPKVVPEAFAAGVGVVISEACAANLTEEEFITVLPEGEMRPAIIAQAIQSAIDRNQSLRPAIRAYGVERFDVQAGLADYLRIIHEFREFFGLGS
jgi:glycosyltransferase involved in cell wall biosynthesis